MIKHSSFHRPNLLLTLSYEGEVIFSAETRTLGEKPLTLGRQGCEWELPVKDIHVSHRHAEVFYQRGHWMIRDLGSRNGVWMLGKQIREHKLAVGDIYIIGSCRLTISKPEKKRKPDGAVRYHLLVRLNGKQAGERIELKHFPMLVGSSEGCDVRLLDSLASKRHAELFESVEEEGSVPGIFLRDLKSTNGTTVNGVPQKAEVNARLLAEGDTLCFATESFRFLDKAFKHDDPKESRRKGVICGSIFAMILLGFLVLRCFVWQSAESHLAKAEALGHACRFTEANEQLEEARLARGAEGLLSEIEACGERLKIWQAQQKKWTNYLKQWQVGTAEVMPQIIIGSAPANDPAHWPKKLNKVSLAIPELEALAFANRTLSHLHNEPKHFSVSEFAQLASLQRLELKGENIRVETELPHMETWITRIMEEIRLAAVDAAKVSQLREMKPQELPRKVSSVSTVKALTEELREWEAVAAWVDAMARARADAIGDALMAEAPLALPAPPTVALLQRDDYKALVDEATAVIQNARLIGERLHPTYMTWTMLATVQPEDMQALDAIVQAWRVQGKHSPALLAFLAAPGVEATNLLPQWHRKVTAACAFLDAVVSLRGCRGFIEQQTPNSDIYRAIRQAEHFMATVEETAALLLEEDTLDAQLKGLLLAPAEVDEAMAQSLFRRWKEEVQ